MDVKNRIRLLMKERKWTEYRLAKEAGLSHSTIENMFKRNNSPTLPTLEALCNAFHITMAQFFSEGELTEVTTEQEELFDKWSRLDASKKAAILHLLDVM